MSGRFPSAISAPTRRKGLVSPRLERRPRSCIATDGANCIRRLCRGSPRSVLCLCPFDHRVPTILMPIFKRCCSRNNRRAAPRRGSPIHSRRCSRLSTSKVLPGHPRPALVRRPSPRPRRATRFRSSARRCCKRCSLCSRHRAAALPRSRRPRSPAPTVRRTPAARRRIAADAGPVRPSSPPSSYGRRQRRGRRRSECVPAPGRGR